MAHIKTLTPAENGGKGGLMLSWPALSAIIAALSFGFVAVISIYNIVDKSHKDWIQAELRANSQALAAAQASNQLQFEAINTRLIDLKMEVSALHDESRTIHR